MTILQLNALGVTVGDPPFADLSLTISKGHRIGLVAVETLAILPQNTAVIARSVVVQHSHAHSEISPDVFETVEDTDGNVENVAGFEVAASNDAFGPLRDLRLSQRVSEMEELGASACGAYTPPQRRTRILHCLKSPVSSAMAIVSVGPRGQGLALHTPQRQAQPTVSPPHCGYSAATFCSMPRPISVISAMTPVKRLRNASKSSFSSSVRSFI